MKRLALIACALLLALAGLSLRRRANRSQAVPSLHPSSPQITSATASPNPRAGKPVSTPALPARDARAAIADLLSRLHAAKTDESELREQLTTDLIALLDEANAAEVTRSLSADDLDAPFGLAALKLWLKADTATAANWIAARPDATEAQARAVAQRLVESPDELRAFCAKLSDSPWEQTFLTAASAEAIAHSPILAIELARRIHSGPTQVDALQTAAYDWMARDPAAASAWIVKVDDRPLREALLSAGARAIAHSDPDLAAGWLVSAVKSESLLTDTALSVVETWSSRDPARAAAWVANFPPRASRDSAIDLVYRQWQQTDATAARAWLEKLPDHAAIVARWQAAQEESARLAKND